MKLNNKNERVFFKIGILLSTCLLSLSAIAAKYEMEGSLRMENESLTDSFLYADKQELQRQQLVEQVKKDYQNVFDLINKKKYVKAREKLALLIKGSPEQSVYYNLEGILYITDKNVVEAKKSFQQAIELNSNNVQAYTALAKLALGDEQFEQAKQYANQTLKITPHALNAYKILADVAMATQGINKAEEVLLKANEEVKGNFYSELEVLKLLAKVYANKKQPQILVDLVTDLVKRYPKEIEAQSALASVQLVSLDVRGAEQTLRHIISQQPKDAKHLFLLARLLGNKPGRETEVLALLDKAAFNLERPALVIAYKTNFLVEQKQFKQAFLVAEQFDKTNPTDGVGKILKGDVYLAEKEYTKALEHYQLAYQITPTAKVLDAMLKVLVLQNNPKQAVTLLEKELSKNKNNLEIQFKLAAIYQSTGNYELAIKQYEDIRIKKKTNVVVLNNLAWAYSQQKNLKKALELSKQAFEIAPQSAAVVDTYGYILLINGHKQECLKVLKQAAELSPESAEIQMHLAEAYVANQNESDARAILQLLISQDSPEKGNAIKLLEQLEL